MAKHISRKDLKRNEFRETLTHGAEAVASHQRLTWIIGGAALAVLLAVFGWRFYAQRQTARATVELTAAMKVYNARIRTANEPAGPDEVTYVDEKNKYADAPNSSATSPAVMRAPGPDEWRATTPRSVWCSSNAMTTLSGN